MEASCVGWGAGGCGVSGGHDAWVKRCDGSSVLGALYRGVRCLAHEVFDSLYLHRGEGECREQGVHCLLCFSASRARCEQRAALGVAAVLVAPQRMLARRGRVSRLVHPQREAQRRATEEATPVDGLESVNDTDCIKPTGTNNCLMLSYCILTCRKKGLKLLKPKKVVKISLDQEIKVIKATAKITPGKAYPDTEKIDK